MGNCLILNGFETIYYAAKTLPILVYSTSELQTGYYFTSKSFSDLKELGNNHS
jgi:hypothetical protein